MDLLVTADDRTGAMETAAALADSGGGPIPVFAWPRMPDERGVAVVDLTTRHLPAGEARRRMRSASTRSRRGHKIDSTLRGNWTHELAELGRDRPVLLVPALPALGRTCEDGVVMEHGRPVHEGSAGRDVRRRITSSRPADLLGGAGVADVASVSDIDSVTGWLESPHGIAVADATDDPTIDRLVAVWAAGAAEVVLAGTSAVVGAATGPARTDDERWSCPSTAPVVLVVCGSLHPVARAQIGVVERCGVPVVTPSTLGDLLRRSDTPAIVLTTDEPAGDVSASRARFTASALADGVTRVRRAMSIGTLVVIGGDTAAAVLGDETVTVHGSVGPGTAWVQARGLESPVITRSGGFGGDRALLDLIRATLQP